MGVMSEAMGVTTIEASMLMQPVKGALPVPSKTVRTIATIRPEKKPHTAPALVVRLQVTP